MSQDEPPSVSGHWFKRRRYGWGYTPVTWQGWTSVGVLLVLVIAPAFWLGDEAAVVAAYLGWVAVVVIAFVALAIRTGPRPRWRWGRSAEDDPGEDF